MRYYCRVCDEPCEVIAKEEAYPYEFWGQASYYREYFLICENCGSFELEELYPDSQESDII